MIGPRPRIASEWLAGCVVALVAGGRACWSACGTSTRRRRFRPVDLASTARHQTRPTSSTERPSWRARAATARCRRRRPTRSPDRSPPLTPEERRAFAVGNNFFNDNWVTAPASTDGRDGLGPVVQRPVVLVVPLPRRPGAAARRRPTTRARACCSASACRGPMARRPVADPVYGGQLQDRAINGVPAEGTHRGSPRPRSPARTPTARAYTLRAPTYEIVDPAFGPLADRTS